MTFRLVRVQGPQPTEAWPISSERTVERPVLIGRTDRDREPPEIDLWPDERVSRQHARLWFEDGVVRIEDLGSKRGTCVGGHRIGRHERCTLEPYAEVAVGDTVLMLVPPQWHRLRSRRGLCVEFDCTQTVNFSLVHCRVPIVSRLVARNTGRDALGPAKLVLAINGHAHADPIETPVLQPGDAHALPDPVFHFNDELARRVESTHAIFSARVGDELLHGEHIECRVLAFNEWCATQGHLKSLAAFVLPNHPLIEWTAGEACRSAADHSSPHELLAALHEYFSSEWKLTYLNEPPSFEFTSQKLRFPHQVLMSPPTCEGQGTCIDLALVFTACLEYLGCRPLLAIVRLGGFGHALVGCWQSEPWPANPAILKEDSLLHDAVWTDPTACTRNLGFGEASEIARQYLNTKRLVFALDVLAARDSGITPLPFIGEPKWHPVVSAAVDKAREFARRGRSAATAVHLLIGLLSAGSLANALLARCAPDAGSRWRDLEARARAGRPGETTAKYDDTLTLASSKAKRVRSPLVLEEHLLSALLDSPSGAIDDALKLLGTTKAAMLDALREERAHPSFALQTNVALRAFAEKSKGGT